MYSTSLMSLFSSFSKQTLGNLHLGIFFPSQFMWLSEHLPEFMELKKGLTRHVSNYLNMCFRQKCLKFAFAAFLYTILSLPPVALTHLSSNIFTVWSTIYEWGDLFCLLTLLQYFNKSRDLQMRPTMLNAYASFSFPSCKGSEPDMEMCITTCPIRTFWDAVPCQDPWIICHLLIAAYLLSLTTHWEACPVISARLLY